ncbi:protein mono-ADP-ribosyltransferase PARP12 [Diabrotica virgifera virgifera]|uniref:Poly [ADP-ribose] polymerase n=1 Tax=Diabrotica virgifera virgifera TaxID=50390 RepID=A0A6P7G8L1_DIAVI|nr:protein mono-ADP-ribosyltransferase PARP12 [Diabrotica virgifera virgifera]
MERICKSDILEQLIFYSHTVFPDNTIYKSEELSSQNEEYKQISKLFKDKNKKIFQIQKIERIHNPYLLTQYAIKKKHLEKLSKQEKTEIPREKRLFHGTGKDEMESICKANFDWRRKGTNVGHRFGQGVSFSANPYYATHYTDDKDEIKVIIVAKVLVGHTCIGNKMMIIPGNCDTSTDKEGQIFIKYDDGTFYPEYRIYYTGFDPEKSCYCQQRTRTISLGDFIPDLIK